MRGIIILVCALFFAHNVLTQVSDTTEEWPKTTEEPEPPVNCDISTEDPDDVILLPDPESCDHFYMCVGLTPVKRPCPDGLHWNTELRVCDWPEMANCTLTS